MILEGSGIDSNCKNRLCTQYMILEGSGIDSNCKNGLVLNIWF